MIMTRDDNKITRLMGLTIVQESKNFKSNSLLRIFGRFEWDFEDFCGTHEQLGMSRHLVSARNYP